MTHIVLIARLTGGAELLCSVSLGGVCVVEWSPVSCAAGLAPQHQLDLPVPRRSARQAAGSNRNRLNGPQRHAAPIAAGPQGRRGASPGWRAVDQAGPPLTGPRWSRVVQGGPGWSRQRGVGGAQPLIPERCAIDAQCDSASIGRVWAGVACIDLESRAG